MVAGGGAFGVGNAQRIAERVPVVEAGVRDEGATRVPVRFGAGLRPLEGGRVPVPEFEAPGDCARHAHPRRAETARAGDSGRADGRAGADAPDARAAGLGHRPVVSIRKG